MVPYMAASKSVKSDVSWGVVSTGSASFSSMNTCWVNIYMYTVYLLKVHVKCITFRLQLKTAKITLTLKLVQCFSVGVEKKSIQYQHAFYVELLKANEEL